MSKLLNSFLVSFNAMIPIAIMLAIGAFLKKRKTISDNFEVEANKVVFSWAMPLYLFDTLYKTNIDEGFSWRLVLLGTAVSAITFVVLCIVTPRIFKSRTRAGAFTSCSVHGGIVFPGIVIAASLLTPEQQVPMLLAIPFWAVTNNLYSTLAYSIFSPKQVERREAFRYCVNQISRNPIVWGVLAGAAANLSGLKLPEFIESVISYMAGVSTPLALITLGARLKWDAFKQDFRDSFLCGVGIKLIFLPLVGCILGFLFGCPGTELLILLLHWGTPVGVSVFSIAMALDGDSRLAGNSIVVSEVMSCLTLFVGIFILSMLGAV